MRQELEKREGKRGVFTATYHSIGEHTRGGHPVRRLLFMAVTDASGIEVADHLWFTETKSWAALHLQPGEKVQFVARAAPYLKGYIAKRRDFKLNNPSKIIVISRGTAPAAGERLLFPDEIA